MPKLEKHSIDKMASRLYEKYKTNGKRGAIDLAIRLLAHEKGIDMNVVASLLKSHGISVSSQASAEDDRRILRAFGITTPIIHDKKLRKAGDPQVTLTSFRKIVTEIWNWISSHWTEPQPVKGSASRPRQDSPPKLRKEFILALVVKGSELNNVQNDQRLSLFEAENLLERASYFAYSSGPEMRQVFSQVQFSTEPVDRQSEQLVLVPIALLSYQSPSSRRFPNKIELAQHMRENAQEFSVQVIRGLEQIGNLVEAGFIGV